MKSKNPWLNEVKKTITPVKHLLSSLSVRVRTDQFSIFMDIIKPTPKTKILDVGVTSDETLKDSNMFEKLYPYPNRLILATIENDQKLKKLYPKSTIKKITPRKKLPFNNQEFDVVVSWATMEHVGDYFNQQFFLKELLRVGKRVFLTTPYRACPYEPHSGIWFIHWLPLPIFRKICFLFNKKFWANVDNLNPLWVKDLHKMFPNKELNIKIYKTLGIIPSHLLIYS